MKTGLESVKAALRLYFDSAAEDLEKTQENLKLGQFTHSREQPRGVTQIINYTTFALLPVLSSLFEHIGQNMFGEDLICAYWLVLLIMLAWGIDGEIQTVNVSNVFFLKNKFMYLHIG